MENRLKRIGNNRLLVNIGIIIIFIVIALISIMQIRTGKIIGQSDFIYHMNRIESFKEAIHSGNWFVFRNFTTFNQIGTANNYFYPYVYLWLWAFPYAIINDPVIAYYLNVFILMMATMGIAYICVNSFTKSRMQATLISVLFTTAPYHIFILSGQSVLGEALAFTFIPLFFLGLYNVIRGNVHKWWIIAIALALTTYAHLITLALEGIIAVVVYFATIMVQKHRVRRFFNIIKAVVLYIILTAFFWIPFVQEYSLTKIQTTISLTKVAFVDDLGTEFWSAISNGFINNLNIPIGPNPGLFALIGIFMLIYSWHYLSVDYRFMGILGIALFISSTTVFPWTSIPTSVQQIIQFPYRFDGLASFCLILVGVKCVEIIGINNAINWLSARRKVTLIVLVVATLLFAGSVFLSGNHNYNNIAYTSTKKHTLKNAFNVNFKLDKNNYNVLFMTPTTFYGTTDYAPVGAWPVDNRNSLITHEVLVKGKKIKSSYTKDVTKITYQFHLKKGSDVDIPVLHYGNEKIILNGKKAYAKQSSRGSTLVRGKIGKNVITISEPLSSIFKVLVFSALVGWMFVVFLAVTSNRQKD